MKEHPIAGDSLLAAVLALFDLLFFVGRLAGSERSADLPPWYVTIPLILGATLPLVFRRRYPVIVAYVTLAASVPHSMLELGASPLFTISITLYTLVVFVNRRTALLYVLVNLVIGGVQIPLQYPDDWVLTVAVSVVATAFTWMTAEFMGARRAYQHEVEQRLAMLETERDQQAAIAVAAERARIARELHDVVAHSVSVMVVQADGAGYALRSEPELAERAMSTISATGREALTELRRLLGVLRDDPTAPARDRDGTDRVPQPGLRAIDDLVQRVRDIGVPVRLTVTGAMDDLPAGVGLGAYRIVQEALTNTIKHGGRSASADVLLGRHGDADGDRVEVTVTDTGSGTPRLLTPVHGGNGLIGMRERANVFGGALTAGPRTGGGWRVHATLPLRDV